MKAGLRKRLRDVAETTGEDVTDAEIETAINWYYRNLHEYRAPKASLSLWVAHVWVRRWAVFGWTLFVAVLAWLTWWIWWG